MQPSDPLASELGALAAPPLTSFSGRPTLLPLASATTTATTATSSAAETLGALLWANAIKDRVCDCRLAQPGLFTQDAFQMVRSQAPIFDHSHGIPGVDNQDKDQGVPDSAMHRFAPGSSELMAQRVPQQEHQQKLLADGLPTKKRQRRCSSEDHARKDLCVSSVGATRSTPTMMPDAAPCVPSSEPATGESRQLTTVCTPPKRLTTSEPSPIVPATPAPAPLPASAPALAPTPVTTPAPAPAAVVPVPGIAVAASPSPFLPAVLSRDVSTLLTLKLDVPRCEPAGWVTFGSWFPVLDIAPSAQDVIRASMALTAPDDLVARAEDACCICMETVNSTCIKLFKCQGMHYFHPACIEAALGGGQMRCPYCLVSYGTPRGPQPDGIMTVVLHPHRLAGEEATSIGTFVIGYKFPDGIQGPQHPHPGHAFEGTTRRGYLPMSKQGMAVLRKLLRAWDARILFTVGTSLTTGQTNCVIWNGIHHKTRLTGGPLNFGFPDPNYLALVDAELSDAGITDA